ncbi:PKD domain-containing protein [Arthrobacter sp. LAR12-1-1.1]|uniref:PKD domain-containing protein n=1 Tax=Arthrobacter sp. LAR12-1-1.1 TaxID=3135215 RepID=UPI0034159566
MKRILAFLMAIFAVVSLAGLASAAVGPPGVNGPGLAEAGPVDATDGYPVWYRDHTGLRLEKCIAQADPLCPARGALPDETAPVSFPDNYPDEGFYSLTTGTMDTAGGGKALAVIALEQAFGSGPVADGDQVTFARLRLKITNVRDGVDYKFTTPAGTKTVRTSKPGIVFDTEDIGIGGKGDFSGALGGRIGPFLTWDTYPTDPALKPDANGKATYVGDGTTPHKITGSPYGSNIFRIEGPGINPGTTDACPSVPGPVADCVETDLFTVQGKLATNSGVAPERATYSRSSLNSGTVDVFASSESGPQSIQLSDSSASGAVFSPTALEGSGGKYFARIAFDGPQPPATVTVTNSSDVPASAKKIDVVDRVSGKATFNTDSAVLSIEAVSSDTAGGRTLTALGFGELASGSLASGPLAAPPVSVTVRSDGKGEVVLPVEVTGSARTPIPVAAQAGADQTVHEGQKVDLDGSASSGPVSTYSWTSPTGIVLSDPNAARPSFTAPAPGDYVFSLTVNGPGGPSTATVTVTVTASVPAAANAGPNQQGVQRGTKVTLDGSGSTGAATYSWTQVVGPGDPRATLAGDTSARPSFTFPLYKFPASSGALTFKLTVGSPDGSSSDAQVTVTPRADTVAVTSARYTASKREWRVDGTSSIPAGQAVTVHLGGLDGTVLGTAVVDATGSFALRVTSTVVGRAGQSVSVESPLGGTATGFAVRVQ